MSNPAKSETMNDLEIRNAAKPYGSAEVLPGMSKEVEQGEFIIFVGPSGCGKSTLLRMIAGLEEISDGKIVIDDKVVNDVRASKRGVAMVFQSYALSPHMTVAENMSVSLKIAGIGKADRQGRVGRAADMLQLTDRCCQKKPA